MKLKKLLTIVLIVAILIAQFGGIKFVYAANTKSVNSDKFHYSQLNEVAKKVYDGIYEMYNTGILKTGTQSFDLSNNDKYVTQTQLENYMKGDKELIHAMNAARYAFYADYPEVFYVNFQNLTLRITKDAKNKYHANIGSGNLKNYYVEGLTDSDQVNEANTEFNNKVNEIVSGANALKIENGQNAQVEKIKYIHNQIIKIAGYRLEIDCNEGNEGFLGTPYGALVKGQAVCEGYARALKTILDKIGINSILVQGMHQSEGSAAVPHMWNYVELDKQTNARTAEKVWYAIDATLDDPFIRNTDIDRTHPDFYPGMDITEGFENTRYCLVGTETMNKEHTAIETVEAAGNYIFKYPDLSVADYGIDTVTNTNGLLVKFKQEGTATEEYKAGDFYVSYNGKGYAKAKEEGKYILVKYHEYRPGDEEWVEGNWGYMDPTSYAGGFYDYDDHIYITVPNAEYMQFAVTTRAPLPTSAGLASLTYQGDGSDFVAKTEKLYNPNGTFKGKPYITKQTPKPTKSLLVGPTYHVDVTYDDDLILKSGSTAIGWRLESTGNTGVEETTLTNFNFDGKRRITFDIKFSKMFADDRAVYKIYLTGVVGKNSLKEPLEITYGAMNSILCPFRMEQAKNWEVFGRPKLIENADLSLEGWQTSDGEPVSDKLRSRVALVTTRTTKAQEETMENLIDTTYPNQEVLTSETYNISLNVCRSYVVKTGHRLRISLGFPTGYGPEDEGVTFKAYHFKHDAQGNVTGVEEIPCVVTKYGLIITCDSFSPFAIAAIKGSAAEGQDRTAVVSASEGGKIEGADKESGNLITVKPAQLKQLTVVADEGYEIETIDVCGQKAEITNKNTMTVNVNYDNISNVESVVKATFVAKSVTQEDEKKGETTVTPVEIVRGFEVSLEKNNENQNLEELKCEDEFEINIHMKNLSNIGKGVLVLAGKLDYNTDLLERVSITGKNGWYIKDSKVEAINPNNNMFIAENDDYVYQSGDILTVKFRVKETATEATNTSIKIKNITSSGGYGIINVKDTEIPIGIIEGTPKEKKIESELYYVNETDKDITKIEPGTTVKTFKENITTQNINKNDLVFTNKNGEKLEENGILTTGVTVTGGSNLRYTLVVVGDINGEYYVDSKGKNIIVDTDDLAKAKLKYLKQSELLGIAFKAADCNYNGQIDVDDIAKIKLIILGL